MATVKYSRWPALKGGDGEECHHPHQHIVKVKVAVEPDPLPDHRVCHISVFIHHEGPPEHRAAASCPIFKQVAQLRCEDVNTHLHCSGVCLASSVQR